MGFFQVVAAGGCGRVTLALLTLSGRPLRVCLTALPALIKQQAKDEAFRAYVTDALKAIAENTARGPHGGGYLKLRYTDIIDPKPEETRTGEEIVDHVKGMLANLGGDTA